MGAVTLDVADLGLMTRFYRDGVGLEIVSADAGGIVTLGRGTVPLVHLRHRAQLKHAGPSEAGLFHTAVLFPDQASLATAIASVVNIFPASFTGSADHLVSEAFYFDDPEGNGVELYFDHPQESWLRTGGQIQMDTLPLDPRGFLESHFDESVRGTNAHTPVTIGHVHLSVGSIDQARDFYINQLGFSQTFAWHGQALFVAAGGYHHHLAMNTWRSRGAGIRQPTLGIGIIEIAIPGIDGKGAVSERLTHFGHTIRESSEGFDVDDPWGNTVRIIGKD